MIQELLKKIEDSYYWDARVKSLDCNYFGDEVKVVFESPKLSEIESADTLFISSTSMAAMPVSTLNSKPIKCDFDFVKRVTTYVRAHELD